MEEVEKMTILVLFRRLVMEGILSQVTLPLLVSLPFRITASHAIFRLAVVNAKGEPAAVSQLLVRWATVWLPLFLPMSIVALLIQRAEGIAFISAFVLLLLWVGAAVYAVIHPHRGLQSRLRAPGWCRARAPSNREEEGPATRAEAENWPRVLCPVRSGSLRLAGSSCRPLR